MAANAVLISAASAAIGAGASVYGLLNQPKKPAQLQEAKTPISPLYGRSKTGGPPKGAIGSLLTGEGGALAKSSLLGS